MENKKSTLQDWKMARNTEKRGKCELHTLGPGTWRETLKKVENEKCSLQDVDYGKKTEKRGK